MFCDGPKMEWIFHALAVNHSTNAIYVANREANSRMAGPGLYLTLKDRRTRKRAADNGRDYMLHGLAVHPTKAASLYQGRGTVTPVERLSKVPLCLGIVAETGGRGDVWRVSFDDALATHVHLNGQTGEFVTSRNGAWVWYDFFWRLHIMDFASGEDFNGTLLRLASVTAFGLVIAGAVLAALAVRRRWRVLHKRSRRTSSKRFT